MFSTFLSVASAPSYRETFSTHGVDKAAFLFYFLQPDSCDLHMSNHCHTIFQVSRSVKTDQVARVFSLDSFLILFEDFSVTVSRSSHWDILRRETTICQQYLVQPHQPVFRYDCFPPKIHFGDSR